MHNLVLGITTLYMSNDIIAPGTSLMTFLCLSLSIGCGGATGATPSAQAVAVPESLASSLDAARVEELIQCSLQLDFRTDPSNEEIAACVALQRQFQMYEGLCAASLVPTDVVNNRFVHLSTVGTVSCEGSRCMVWVEDADPDQPDADPQFFPMHLDFDGTKLVGARIGQGQALADTFPEPTPRVVAPQCSPAFMALSERSIHEELWQVRGSGGEYTAERLCGDAALSRLEALGLRWECEGHYCESLDACGNNCASVSTFEHEGSVFVLGAFDGMEGGGGIALEPAKLERLRERVECGATVPVERDDFAVELREEG